MYSKVSAWLDHVLEQNIPDEVAAFCFNLYDDGNHAWSMELIGTERFDENDDDWPCDEIADFGTREGLLRWDKEAEWFFILEEVKVVLSEYLKKGRFADVLKSKEGVGVGFVDGDIAILYKNEAIYTRRSIRKFSKDPVSKSILEQIIDAGRAAPSAKNRQPWKYLVYSGKAKEKLLAIMKKGIEKEESSPRLPLSVDGIPDAKNTLRIMESAPIVIIVLNINGKSPFEQLNADERFAEINDMLSIGASIENMLLKAEELSVGTLWIGNTCFAYQELIEYIGLHAELACAVALGYKAEKPAARPRKKLEDIVEYYD